jgi:hypothetical protein
MALTPQETRRAREIIAAAPEPVNVTTLRRDRALLVLRHLHGLTAAQAEQALAIELGEISGDIVEVSGDG